MDSHEDKLVAVAMAEDTYDLTQHIAWEKVIKPRLEKEMQRWAALLVDEALGAPLPPGLTREQIAGRCYGVKFISALLEKILRDGEQALKDLQKIGLHLA